MNPLKKEFEFYLKNQEKLLKEHDGKYLVIKDSAVKGSFNSFEEAVAWASEQYELGSFLVQHCTPGNEAYTQTFHSRVVFA